MDDFVAYPSRGKIAMALLGGLAFVGLGLWMTGVFGGPPMSRRFSPEIIRLIGLVTVVFFGYCSVVGARRLFDEREQVRIGEAGIRLRSWSEKTIPWSEIVDITTWTYRGQKSIVLLLRDRRLFPGRGIAAVLSEANRGLTGGDIVISFMATNRKIEEALAAIARFRLGA